MTRAKIIIAVLWMLAIVLAGWTLARLPLHEIASSLRNVSLPEYLIWAAFNVLFILILNQRWWLLSKAINAEVNFLELLLIRQAGQSVSFITPGPQFGGEPLQLFWLWRRARLPLHKALLSLGLDRVFELAINFFVLIFGVVLLLMTPASKVAAWETILAVLVGALIAMLLMGKLIIRQPDWLLRRLSTITHRWQEHRYLQSISTHWNLLNEDLRFCFSHQTKHLVLAGLLSIAGWVALIAEMFVVLWMADVTISISGFLLLFVALRIALLLPLPGGIGTLEAAIFWTFNYLNISAEHALAVIALMRLRDVIVLVAGLGCLALLQKPKASTVS